MSDEESVSEQSSEQSSAQSSAPSSEQVPHTTSQESSSSADQAPDASTIKDPSEWVTGGEPATGAQLSYLHTLATEVGGEVPEDLTKAAASEMIDELSSSSQRVRSQD